MLADAQIQQVISRILAREGGDVNNPADRGGETHFGITAPFAQQWHIAWPPTQQDARDGYRRMLAGTAIDQIPDFATFDLVADSAVNHGPGTAIRWLQKAIVAQADGVIGPQTLRNMQSMVPVDWPVIKTRILSQRIKFYGAIVVADPTQVRFLAGWLNRACEFIV